MAYKTFTDPDGGKWQVWRVDPTGADSGRTVVSPDLQQGWLCFENDAGEKRRLAPIPDGWEKATVDKLWLWCRSATPAMKCEPGQAE